MNVYTYWECPNCEHIIKGDRRTCPGCGSPIPNDAKYMMPDNAIVIRAKEEGRILVGRAK